MKPQEIKSKKTKNGSGSITAINNSSLEHLAQSIFKTRELAESLIDSYIKRGHSRNYAISMLHGLGIFISRLPLCREVIKANLDLGKNGGAHENLNGYPAMDRMAINTGKG